MLNPRTHRSKRLRPSPAMVVALIALFMSIGGVGYAASMIGTNQIKSGAVTTRKLHNGAVTTKKIQNGAVRSSQVRNGSLLAKDFKAGQLPAEPPSAAFHVTAATGPSNIALSPAFTTVLTLTLPPGNYVLNAKVVATNHSTTTATDVRCALFSDKDTTGADNYPVSVPAGSTTAIPLQGVRIVTGSSSIQSLACRKGANVTMSIDEDPQFTAIQVGKLS
jgi:hypothetical protein